MNNLEQIPQDSRVEAQIRRGIRTICIPGQVYELRCPKAGKYRTISGYFDDFEAMADQACFLSDGRAVPAVYVTVNPVSRDLLARAYNHVKDYAEATTSDKDIPWLLRLLIDLDAIRPTGISASDQEHELARSLASTIREYLTSSGWPKPVFSDSGNGGHLIYAIDLENTPENVALLQGVLKALHGLFSTDKVKVDTSTFNPARIVKLPGTKARKGDHMPGFRPHRRSCVIEAPEALEPVPVALLRDLAGIETKPCDGVGAFDRLAAAVLGTAEATGWDFAVPATGGAWTRQRLERWLDDHGVGHREAVEGQDGRLKYVLEHCVFNSDHAGKDAAIFLTVDGPDRGMLGYKCFHDSCSGKTWADVREKLDPKEERKPSGRGDTSWIDDIFASVKGGDGASAGEPQPEATETLQPEPPRSRYLLDLEKDGIKVLETKAHNGSVLYPVECPCCGLVGTFSWNTANFRCGYDCAAGRRTWAEGKSLWAATSAGEGRKRRGFLVDELDAIPTPAWIVKDHLLTDSLAVVYGPSNVGKTFFGLDLGLSVATGAKFAGTFDVTQGAVAYVIGEGVGGIKKRIKAWKSAHGHSGSIDRFVIIPYQFALAAVDPGEAREIVEIAAGRLGCKPSLVIIDTLARNFGAGANENDTAVMSAFVNSCDLIKGECGGSVVVVHHTGKDHSKGMRGAYSLVGGADTILHCGEHGHRMGMEIGCEKQKDVDFFQPYVLLKEVVDLGDDGMSLAFRYEDMVFGTSKADTPIAQWKNEAEIVYHFSPETAESAKAKVHIVADVRAGMLSRQMTPLGENKVRTLIDTLVFNGRLAATGGEKNEKHAKYYKNTNPSAGFTSDFFEGGDEPVGG